MNRRPARPFLLLLGAWVGIALVGSIVGAAHDGAGSIWPNFARYGLGGGAIVAGVLAALYWADNRRQ